MVPFLLSVSLLPLLHGVFSLWVPGDSWLYVRNYIWKPFCRNEFKVLDDEPSSERIFVGISSETWGHEQSGTTFIQLRHCYFVIFLGRLQYLQNCSNLESQGPWLWGPRTHSKVFHRASTGQDLDSIFFPWLHERIIGILPTQMPPPDSAHLPAEKQAICLTPTWILSPITSWSSNAALVH